MLDSILDAAGGTHERFTVYGTEPDVVERFETYGVDVTSRPLPPGAPEPFLVIETEGEFAGALSVTDLEGLLEPPVVRPGTPDEISAGYRALFEVLDGTVYRAMSRRALLAVTREIEERAFRLGTGTLRVSFQRLSAFEAQVDLYRLLGEETDLDVHIYGAGDWTPPSLPGVTYHDDVNEELQRYWVLAFVGETADVHSAALLAREDVDEYDGVWTDDPALVDEIAGVLAAV